MNKFTFLTILAAALSFGSCAPDEDFATLQAEFQNPPQEARPRVWWHWEDGNVTKDGIRKDLEWMHRIGIGGYHHFDAGINMEPVVENRMVYMHDDWKDAFRYAIRMSDSLGMTVGIASSPGWSNTGGPWVEKDDAMKRLVWSYVDVEEGNGPVQLPQPKSNLDYYKDIKVLAVYLPDDCQDYRSIKVYGRGGRNMWNVQPYDHSLILEATDDGTTYREITRIPGTNAGDITVNFTPTKAQAFRLRSEKGEKVPEYTLFNQTRIEHAEEKAGFSSPYDLNEFPTILPEGEDVAAKESVTDLTDMMQEDGTVNWDAPYGTWRIIRFGYTLTGKRNGPAPKEATGLEVDKLDQRAYHDYFIKYLDMYKEATDGMIGSKGITELLVDSYEAGWQTWTPKMFEEFEARRGYSMLPWMPVLTGEILESAEASEKFLFDWRRTIGELYQASYESVRKIADEYGIQTVCLESQENGRVFVTDGMSIKRHADVPMAACWAKVDRSTSHSTIPVAIADMRESASLSHLYGGQWVATESFTADGWEDNAYTFTPERIKWLADTEFASGINRIFVHESSSQPLDDCKPGLGLMGYGQWFNRHETWAEQARAWTDYLARTSYMMSRGSNIADVLVYYGEDTNVTAKYALQEFQVPVGYNYDFINADGLFDIEVKGGRIVAPSGAEYSVLCLDIAGLPQSEEVAARLQALKDSGAPICDVKDLQAAVASTPKDVDGPADLRFVHRKAGNTEFYWIDNPADTDMVAEISLRCSGNEPMIWNPDNGEMTPCSYRIEDGRTVIPMSMHSNDAVFVVFTPAKAKAKYNAPAAPKTSGKSLELDAWKMEFPQRTLDVDGLKDYTTFEYEDVKYFSGTCKYTAVFSLDRAPRTGILDLGRVCDLCELKVNGEYLGILWRAPFKADISDALKAGENTIEIDVVNTWVNRLIGDAQPDCPKVTTYTTADFYKADHALAPAGLLGPVVIEY